MTLSISRTGVATPMPPSGAIAPTAFSRSSSSGGRRDRSEVRARTVIVAVVVGPAGDGEVERRRPAPVARHILRRVLAVKHLDGVEARGGPLADAGIAAVEGRMRQRDDRAAAVQDVDDLRDGGPFSRHPGGAAFAEEAIERIGLRRRRGRRR